MLAVDSSRSLFVDSSSLGSRGTEIPSRQMGKWTGTAPWCGLMLTCIDKLYITQSEWTNWFGGAKARKEELGFKRLSFNHCALSLKPYSDPVCTPEGVIFDLINIVPYIRKHGKNPATGGPLNVSDLIRLHMAKNESGEFYCPVTLRTLHDNLHIVVNKKTGNVYSREAIDRLGDWTDFLTGEPFTSEDVLDLQNPADLEKANMVKFHHLRQLEEDDTEPGLEKAPEPAINLSGTTGRLAEQVRTRAEAATQRSQGKVAASLTSTFMTPVTVNDYAATDTETAMFRAIKTPGRVIMRTNFGDLTFELECHKVPKTCYNFIQLAKRGYYQRVRFHRLIPGFMVQGGDPTGEGTGGESIWGQPFANEFHQSLSHSRRAILSMANRGKPCSNTSQFFITFAAKKHLDRIHPVFGHLIAGDTVLDAIERVPQQDSRPLQEIVIEDVVVMLDPFEDYQKTQSAHLDSAARKRQAAAIDPTLAVKRAKASVNTASTIGKYMRRQ